MQPMDTNRDNRSLQLNLEPTNQASFRNEKMRSFSKEPKDWKTFQNSSDSYATRTKHARIEKLFEFRNAFLQEKSQQTDSPVELSFNLDIDETQDSEKMDLDVAKKTEASKAVNPLKKILGFLDQDSAKAYVSSSKTVMGNVRNILSKD